MLVEQEPGRTDFGGCHALAHHQRDGGLAKCLDAITAKVDAIAAAATGQRMHLHAGCPRCGGDRFLQRRALQWLPGHRYHDTATGKGHVTLCGAGGERLEGGTRGQALGLQAGQCAARVVVAPVDHVGEARFTTDHSALYRGNLERAGAAVDAAATARRGHTVGRGDRIAGAAVEHVALDRRGLGEDRMDQAELRLLHRHHVGTACFETLAINGDGAIQRMHFNPVQQQQFQQASGQCRIMRIAENEALHRLLRGLLQRALEELLLQIEQGAAFGHRTAHRAQAGGNLVADGERERQQAIHRFLHATTRAGLFDGDTDRAVEVRIGRAVHRREIVEVLTGVVQRTQRIECLGVVLGQGLVELVRRCRDQRTMHALRRWLEVVRAVLAHLVEVDLHVRVPLVELRHLGSRILLGQRQPIAVEIGEVVVGAALRERLDVLLVGRIGRGRI
ncbi:hypothetical protein D3C81_606840 [compost metagenome]